MADISKSHKETVAWEGCISACTCDICSMFHAGCCALLSFIESNKSSLERSRDNCYLQQIKTEVHQCELCGQDLQGNEGFIFFNSDLHDAAAQNISRRQCVICYMEHCTGESPATGKGHWLHLGEDEASHSDIPCSFEMAPRDREEHYVCVHCHCVFSSHQELECHMRLQHDDVPESEKYSPPHNFDCYPDIESRPEMKLSPLHVCTYDARCKDHSHTNHVLSEDDFETNIWALLNGSFETVSCKIENTEYEENNSVDISRNDNGLKEDKEDVETLPASKEAEGLGIRIVDVWSEAPEYS